MSKLQNQNRKILTMSQHYNKDSKYYQNHRTQQYSKQSHSRDPPYQSSYRSSHYNTSNHNSNYIKQDSNRSYQKDSRYPQESHHSYQPYERGQDKYRPYSNRPPSSNQYHDRQMGYNKYPKQSGPYNQGLKYDYKQSNSRQSYRDSGKEININFQSKKYDNSPQPRSRSRNKQYPQQSRDEKYDSYYGNKSTQNYHRNDRYQNSKSTYQEKNNINENKQYNRRPPYYQNQNKDSYNNKNDSKFNIQIEFGKKNDNKNQFKDKNQQRGSIQIKSSRQPYYEKQQYSTLKDAYLNDKKEPYYKQHHSFKQNIKQPVDFSKDVISIEVKSRHRQPKQKQHKSKRIKNSSKSISGSKSHSKKSKTRSKKKPRKQNSSQSSSSSSSNSSSSSSSSSNNSSSSSSSRSSSSSESRSNESKTQKHYNKESNLKKDQYLPKLSSYYQQNLPYSKDRFNNYPSSQGKNYFKVSDHKHEHENDYFRKEERNENISSPSAQIKIQSKSIDIVFKQSPQKIELQRQKRVGYQNKNNSQKNISKTLIIQSHRDNLQKSQISINQPSQYTKKQFLSVNQQRYPLNKELTQKQFYKKPFNSNYQQKQPYNQNKPFYNNYYNNYNQNQSFNNQNNSINHSNQEYSQQNFQQNQQNIRQFPTPFQNQSNNDNLKNNFNGENQCRRQNSQNENDKKPYTYQGYVPHSSSIQQYPNQNFNNNFAHNRYNQPYPPNGPYQRPLLPNPLPQISQDNKQLLNYSTYQKQFYNNQFQSGFQPNFRRAVSQMVGQRKPYYQPNFQDHQNQMNKNQYNHKPQTEKQDFILLQQSFKRQNDLKKISQLIPCSKVLELIAKARQSLTVPSIKPTLLTLSVFNQMSKFKKQTMNCNLKTVLETDLLNKYDEQKQKVFENLRLLNLDSINEKQNEQINILAKQDQKNQNDKQNLVKQNQQKMDIENQQNPEESKRPKQHIWKKPEMSQNLRLLKSNLQMMRKATSCLSQMSRKMKMKYDQLPSKQKLTKQIV